jgi:uncharacterized protein YukE
MGSTTTLAATAYDWVGGNFAGLAALQGQCGQVASTINSAGNALSGQVSAIVGAGNWSGSAASAFTSAWNQDSTAGAQVADGWNQVGAIAGNLAAYLASLENALEQAASQLEQQGVAVDTADGTALPDTTANGLACPSPQAAAANAKLAAPYTAYRSQILGQASAARAQAALSLNQVAEAMLPGQADWGDPVNGLDAVRSLWAVPTTYRREVVKDLAKAEINADSVERSALRQLIDNRKVSGNNARLSDQMREDLQETRAERSALQGKLATAPEGGTDTMLADGDAGGLGLAGAAAGAVKAVPYLGATAGAVITIWQDKEAGEPWEQYVSDGVVSNGAALGTGLLVAGAFGASSVGAVAAGVLVGGAVAVGVGDFVHAAFQENWSTDIQAYGVAGGIVHGLGDTASATGHSVAHLAGDIASLF